MLEQNASIPVSGIGIFGGEVNMVTRVFLPEGPGPFPVVLFSHGRAPDQAGRARLRQPLARDHARFWVEKGFAVVAPIRPGYGETGGEDRESSRFGYRAPGACASSSGYRHVAQSASEAIAAALAWIRLQPWARAHDILLEGQSVGGLATVAAIATKPDGVRAYINFAGGTGGDPVHHPGNSCDPEQLAALYADFGKTTVAPGLWVYALNDQFWGADVPVVWFDSFAAGGSPARFLHAPAVPDGDGHGLSRHERAYWAPYIDAFLRQLATDYRVRFDE
ncbi:alpha/beta hydrolase family protein [Paludibacterium yongneupense]|uniref:alpha/beta hydrolase family protein n=1 Tax=Paludibacterium yongneupense TaxID=400061 RepID=UPI000421FE89|nr:hypothetical protein [Paludibacterium yongneupense]